MTACQQNRFNFIGRSNGNCVSACASYCPKLLPDGTVSPWYDGAKSPAKRSGLALGAGFSSGLNLYAHVPRRSGSHSASECSVSRRDAGSAHPWVLGNSIALYLLEVFADKIPYVDTVWDAIHTFIPATRRCASRVCCRREPAHRNGAGAPALIAGESLLLRMAQKPVPALP